MNTYLVLYKMLFILSSSILTIENKLTAINSLADFFMPFCIFLEHKCSNINFEN